MRLQQVVTTWTCRTNTLLVVKLVGLDISFIVGQKIWLEWTTFLLVYQDILMSHYKDIVGSCPNNVIRSNVLKL
jgi:hypothetical protein